jgi:hypothetical protein
MDALGSFQCLTDVIISLNISVRSRQIDLSLPVRALSDNTLDRTNDSVMDEARDNVRFGSVTNLLNVVVFGEWSETPALGDELGVRRANGGNKIPVRSITLE